MALLRIRKLPEVSVRIESDDGEVLPVKEDKYLERLLKLIPSDVVGIYIIGRHISNSNNATHWWALICLILVIAIRILATRESKRTSTKSDQNPNVFSNVQWPTVIISTISFIVWIYTLGDSLPWLNFFPSWIASLMLLVWTVLVPYLYKGDTVSS